MPEVTPFKASLQSGTTGPAPLIRPFLPEKLGYGGAAIVVFAGGGYMNRMPYEADEFAAFFAFEGIASFVVDYRVRSEGEHLFPSQIEDAFAAISTIRRRAREFGIDPNKIGVIGASAGGHLAAHTTVAWRDYESDVPLRPDFSILCYPVIYMHGQFTNGGSVKNLLGENPSAEALENTNVVERVDAETPPCFIWHTVGDKAVPVENSLGFATALRVHDVPFELHIYQRGRHGIARKAGLNWDQDCLRWLRDFADARLPTM